MCFERSNRSPRRMRHNPRPSGRIKLNVQAVCLIEITDALVVENANENKRQYVFTNQDLDTFTVTATINFESHEIKTSVGGDADSSDIRQALKFVDINERKFLFVKQSQMDNEGLEKQKSDGKTSLQPTQN